LDIEGDYRFESITIKTTEKRLDGFCYRTDGDGPNVFVEIQGYDDQGIYWRALREIATYYELTNDGKPFIIIVLFLDEKYAPKICPFDQIALPYQCIRANLPECLRRIWQQAGALTVLKPLAVSSKDQVFEEIHQWKVAIQTLDVPEEKQRVLLNLLEFLLVQRFPTMSRKEIETMLHLTPIEETAVGQELIQLGKQEGHARGRAEGEKRGLNKGELIGEIRALQKVLKQPVTPVKHLVPHSLKTLRTMLKELEAELTQIVP
jgi:predicted transposase YdaD